MRLVWVVLPLAMLGLSACVNVEHPAPEKTTVVAPTPAVPAVVTPAPGTATVITQP